MYQGQMDSSGSKTRCDLIELLALSLSLVNYLSSVFNDLDSLVVEDWEHWNSLDTVLLFHSLFALEIEWNGNPWHSLVVTLECIVVFITCQENNLKVLGPIFVDLFIKLAEHWSKVSARRAPMSAEIDGIEFVAFDALGKGFLSVLGEDFVDVW